MCRAKRCVHASRLRGHDAENQSPMSHHDDAYLRHQRERWLRHDAHLWIRPDAARWVLPGFDPADVFPTLARERAQAEAAKEERARRRTPNSMPSSKGNAGCWRRSAPN